MRLGFLSGRSDNESESKAHSAPQARNEPQFSTEPPPPRLPPAARPEAASTTSAHQPVTASAKNHSVNETLLERIAAFREQVAADLYDRSSDYQILCHLTHSDLKSSELLLQELRMRLSSDTSYLVLAKLDEAYAIVESRLPAAARAAA